jgi:hypothetical protein
MHASFARYFLNERPNRRAAGLKAVSMKPASIRPQAAWWRHFCRHTDGNSSDGFFHFYRTILPTSAGNVNRQRARPFFSPSDIQFFSD